MTAELTDDGLLTADDLAAAAKTVRGSAVRTPLLPAAWAGSLWLKAENLQPTGAFKIRGVANRLAALTPEEAERGVVAHSSGNHAQAVAAGAHQRGVPAVLVVPDTAPGVKVAATRSHGAEVVLVPPEQRAARTRELADRHGYTTIPPYDDPLVVAGQGTVGMEILADLPSADVVLVPVSGGGLIAGVAAAFARLHPSTRVIGVEPELAGDARASLRAGERVTWPLDDVHRTIADGLRVTPVGELPWRHIRAWVDDVVTVTEDEIRQATRLLARRSRLVAEPSGAVATAAHLFRDAELPPGQRVAVVSGGNVDPSLFAEILTG